MTDKQIKKMNPGNDQRPGTERIPENRQTGQRTMRTPSTIATDQQMTPGGAVGVIPGQMPPPGGMAGKQSVQGVLEEMEGKRDQERIDQEALRRANNTLLKYKGKRAMLERRLIENEKWWEGRAWNLMREGNPYQAQRSTKWLFNVIMGKHADMVEAYPEPVILPREQDDEQEASTLQAIIPVILKHNGYEKTYNDQAWGKNKSGITFTAVTWDSGKLNGLGDVSVTDVDPLNVIWEPGIADIQKSKNLYILSLQDKEDLIARYPQLRNKQMTSAIGLAEYDTADRPETSEKAVVVDWYYHTYSGGKRLLHYCKYCGDTVLYASENDPALRDRGWYDDGDYPIVADPLFRVKNHVDGLGYIDLGRDTQETIDVLDQAIVSNATSGAIPRWLVSTDANINEAEYADHTRPFVHVEGTVTEANIMPVQRNPLGGVYVQVLNNKIEELKQTTGNQDVNNGSIGSGVTASTAISQLMEAAGRSSRDGITGTYRAYGEIIRLIISRIRQFYDAPRKFRITGAMGQPEYVTYTNAGLQSQHTIDPALGILSRMPEFDIDTDAQKQSAYSKMAQNELAKELLAAGVFNPQNADQSMMMLDMMDFKDKDKLMQKVQQNAMLIKQMAMWQQMAITLAQKYGDPLAEQLASGVMEQAGMQPAQPAPNKGSAKASAHGDTRVEKAREHAHEVSQPQ